MEDFINREKELELLENALESNDAEMIIIYGRRRVGKSELVRRSIKNRENALYYQATETTPSVQLDEFIEAVKKQFPEVKNVRKDWEAILDFLSRQNTSVVIDEFPFLIEADSSIPSKFQRVWDTKIKDTESSLILIGSSISIMEDKVLSSSSPLYGRRTQSIELKQLSFDDASLFYPGYSVEEKIKAWSIFGGTPYYLNTLDSEKSLEENLKQLIISEQGVLRDEPEFLIRTELNKPNRYMSILKAVAKGKTKRNEIAQDTDINPGSVGTYLSKLEKLRILEREVPVTEEKPRSKRGLYRIREPLIRFWFRFIYGKEDSIRLSENPYQELIDPELNEFVSPQFERLCQEKMPELLDRRFSKIGRWWYQEHEIDIVCKTRKGKIIGECKFRNSKIGLNEFEKLKQKEKHLRLQGETEYVFFSKSGFTEQFTNTEKNRDDLHLFDLSDF